MRWNSFKQRLRALCFRRSAESDLNDELTAHIEFQIRKYRAEGMSEAEARRRARIKFGGIESTREECRAVDRWRWVDTSARNLRHCFRSLRKSPGFVTVSILILTVSIGSNLAVFTTMDALLLRPLPVHRPDELVRISLVGGKGDLLELPSTGLRVLEGNRALQGLCGFGTWDESMLGVEIGGNVRPVGVGGFTGDCFRTLGLRVQLGRPIIAADDQLGTQGIAVITDSLWHSTFGARADVLGKTVKIGGQIYTIVGVTQKGFTGLLLGFPREIMIPLRQAPDVLENGTKPSYHWVTILARRAQGVSEGQARASILAQRRRLLEESVPHRYNAAERKDYLSRKLAVMSGKSGIDYFLRNRFGQPLYAVFGICAALLLIACVNLTTLLLARSLNRRREVAVRLALGASRKHIAALFILESTTLVFAGTVGGIFAGMLTARMMLAKSSPIFNNFRLDAGVDARVVCFLLGVVALVLGIFAIASVWQAHRLSKTDSLNESGRGVIAKNSIAQKMLIGIQIALTLAFVTASALFGASVKNMYSIDFGIDTRNVWDIELAERSNIFAPTSYYLDLVRQIESLPDVKSASITDWIPFFTDEDRDLIGTVENARIGNQVEAREIGVSDNFFRTLGVKIIAGEDFRRDASKSGEPTAIVSESLARHFGSPRDLIGHHVRVGNEAEYQRLKVIGIASDTDMNLANLRDTKPFTVYISFWQHRGPQRYPVLLVKTRGDVLPSDAIRRIVKQKGYQYVDRLTTIASEIDYALLENRFLAYLSGLFGMLALVMAAVGLFGLLSYQVANRTSEIGIRMALGATRRGIRRLVLQQIARLLLFGTLAGVAVTLAIGRVMADLLYGVSAYDGAPLLFSIAVLTATALIAAWIPVQRASAIDPMQALRHE